VAGQCGSARRMLWKVGGVHKLSEGLEGIMRHDEQLNIRS
jgi:hypothetical protein